MVGGLEVGVAFGSYVGDVVGLIVEVIETLGTNG